MMRKALTLATAACLLGGVALFLPRHESAPLSADSYETTLALLRTPQAITDAAVRDALVRKAFLADPASGVPFLLQTLWREPLPASAPRERRQRETDRLTARTVLGMMPAAVQEQIAELPVRDPFRRARLLEALGAFRTERALIRLSEALGDPHIADRESPEMGWPLRVCDVAYNTLTLRLRLEGFRTPLGTGHTLAQRDRWVRRLADWLDGNAERARAVFTAPL